MDGDVAPVWLVVTAVAGALAGAWLTASRDRVERKRDRMIDAATDLLAVVNAYLAAARRPITALEGGQPAHEIGELVEASRAAAVDVNGAIGRLWLLYGKSSEPGRIAQEFGKAVTMTQRRLEESPPDPGAARAEQRVLRDGLEEFIREADRTIARVGRLHFIS